MILEGLGGNVAHSHGIIRSEVRVRKRGMVASKFIRDSCRIPIFLRIASIVLRVKTLLDALILVVLA